MKLTRLEFSDGGVWWFLDREQAEKKKARSEAKRAGSVKSLVEGTWTPDEQ
jgi:hypothetical protein